MVYNVVNVHSMYVVINTVNMWFYSKFVIVSLLLCYCKLKYTTQILLKISKLVLNLRLLYTVCSKVFWYLTFLYWYFLWPNIWSLLFISLDHFVELFYKFWSLPSEFLENWQYITPPYSTHSYVSYSYICSRWEAYTMMYDSYQKGFLILFYCACNIFMWAWLSSPYVLYYRYCWFIQYIRRHVSSV